MPSASLTAAAAARVADVRASMRSHKIDGLVITDLPSIRYLFGFSGSSAVVILGRKTATFITNDLYTVQVEQEVVKLPGTRIVIDRNVWSAVKQAGVGSSMKVVGYDASRTTVAALPVMKKALAPAKLVDVGDLLSPVTQVKTKTEITSISKAAAIASAAYERMLGIVSAGMTEHQVATYLAATTRELGSEKDAFDIIVVAGARSAMPHGRASHAKIKRGDVVTVDFGCTVNGLHSDMTRTFCVGVPRKDVVDVFAVLYDAHLNALDAAVAGVGAAALDAAARSIIERAGYGEYFKHSLGHGLGYEVHEHPRISWANKDGVVLENSVITIEPGIYLPGRFGMRIEDDVLVRRNGSKILTTAPRELVVV